MDILLVIWTKWTWNFEKQGAIECSWYSVHLIIIPAAYTYYSQGSACGILWSLLSRHLHVVYIEAQKLIPKFNQKATKPIIAVQYNSFSLTHLCNVPYPVLISTYTVHNLAFCSTEHFIIARGFSPAGTILTVCLWQLDDYWFWTLSCSTVCAEFFETLTISHWRQQL